MKEVYVLTQYYIYDNCIEGIFGNKEAIKDYIFKFYSTYYDGDRTYTIERVEFCLDERHIDVYYRGLEYPLDDLFCIEKYQVIE